MRTVRYAVLSLLAVSTVACDKKAEPTPSTASSSAVPQPSATPSAVTPAPDHAAQATALAAKLAVGDFDAVAASLSGKLKESVSPAKLAGEWPEVTKPLGAFRAVGSAKTKTTKSGDDVVVTLDYEQGHTEVTVGFDATGDAIVRLHTHPVLEYKAPAYVDATKFTATEVSVGNGPAALPGTLCIPTGTGPFPAIFLVHGSGPGDRDDSIGGSRPFRDLAEGLASRGIAVLRYDKRTHGMNLLSLGIRVEDLTVKEEYFDDAAMAAAFLEARPEVDKHHVFLAGHSLGGGLAPKMATLRPELAGIITLAGNARPFVDIALPQVIYVAQGDPFAQPAIDNLKAQVAKAKDPALKPDTPTSELPFGTPKDTRPAGKYWIALRGLDAASVIEKVKQPFLVLQGARDYQVTEKEDFALWKKLLAKHDAEFHVYPALNHAFFAGEGPIRREEYQKTGHVDAAVIDDIAAWVVKKLKG